MGRFHTLFTQLYGYEPSIEIPVHEKTKSLFHTTLITYPHSYGKIKDIDLSLPFDSIHILPFFESTSDGGFAVKDYMKIPKEFGTWGDVRRISSQKNLMADLILNHVSSNHKWFKSFLQGGKYKDFFHSYDKKPSSQGIYRPRTAELFSAFKTNQGKKYVWTTFSKDQIDLNYDNPQVLFAMLDVMKELILKGIKLIRLDAVGYAWKELGTSCFHHEKTFLLVELFREYAASIDPSVRLVAEIVDEQEISDQYLECTDFVYDFRPGSACLLALQTSDAELLYKIDVSQKRFAVLSTHDGTSLNVNHFSPDEKKVIAKGKKGYRVTSEGKEVYELQSSFRHLAKKGFYVSHAFLLFCFQRSGIYYRNLHLVKNNTQLFLQTGEGRSLNRGTVVKEAFDEKLLRLIELRHETELLEFGHSIPIRLSKGLFGCLRYKDGKSLFIILNFTGVKQEVSSFGGLFDIISKNIFDGFVQPYGFVVLKKP